MGKPYRITSEDNRRNYILAQDFLAEIDPDQKRTT
jgi:hypothetical protein